MNNWFKNITLSALLLFACMAFACIDPPVTPPVSPNQVYGVTLTNPWGTNLSNAITALKNLAHKATARIVFDEGQAALNYKTLTAQVHAVAGTMGEILDSYYVPTLSVEQYTARVTEYLSTLGASVDIWEVCNECNGEWLVKKGSGTNADVVNKMTGAYDLVKNQGKTAAITFYYNAGCYEKASNEMFTWINANVPSRIKSGLDYALISYYEKDCNNVSLNSGQWTTVFNQLGAIFPNARLGFGERGTNVAANKAALVTAAYQSGVTSQRFIGGVFWWYFDANSNSRGKTTAGDMVPMSNPLFTTLNNAIQ